MKRYLVLTFVLCIANCFAQKELKEFYLKRSLKQDGRQFNFQVLEDDKHGVWFYDQQKFYYWFMSQRVHFTQGQSSGILLNGKFESFYVSKQLCEKGIFSKGLKHGDWKYWREDGTIERSEKWFNGRLKTQKWFDEQGNLVKTNISKRNGFFIESGDTLTIEKKGLIVQRVIYDEQGRVQQEERFKEGKMHGKQTSYAEGKLISSVRYKKGKLIDKVVKDEEPKETKKTLKERFKKKEKEEPKGE
ncbi:MAG: hypothetical protein MK066_09080 [Crocinitomicaceae bacterium]|nr:hypothetical protein [Crocinitomicaceae bacterium]